MRSQHDGFRLEIDRPDPPGAVLDLVTCLPPNQMPCFHLLGFNRFFQQMTATRSPLLALRAVVLRGIALAPHR
jgi:hypothetical protein